MANKYSVDSGLDHSDEDMCMDFFQAYGCCGLSTLNAHMS